MSEHHTDPILIHYSCYVLRCQGDRFYIGVTHNLSHRFAQHFQSRGSQFMRAYKPISIEEVIFHGNQAVEKSTTLKYIERYGFNFTDGTPRVRGAGHAALASRCPAGARASSLGT